MLNVELVISFISLIISFISLVIAIWSVYRTQKIAVTDRKAQVFQDTLVYLDKLKFCYASPNFGFGNTLIKDVDDEWIKKEVLVAVDINTRLNIFDEEIEKLFWDIVSEIYGENHYFDNEKYSNLKTKIKSELKK